MSTKPAGEIVLIARWHDDGKPMIEKLTIDCSRPLQDYQKCSHIGKLTTLSSASRGNEIYHLLMDEIGLSSKKKPLSNYPKSNAILNSWM